MIVCDFIFKDNIYIFNVTNQISIIINIENVSAQYISFSNLDLVIEELVRNIAWTGDPYESKTASYTFLAWQKQYTKIRTVYI